MKHKNKNNYTVITYHLVSVWCIWLLLLYYDSFIGVLFYFSVADIPGLITGAHLNKGLGHAFLRHIERCRCLLYVLDISHMDSLITFASLRQELELYKEQLSQRPAAIVANKIDIAESEVEIQRLKNTFSLPIIPVSAKYGSGIPELKKKLRKMFTDSVVISWHSTVSDEFPMLLISSLNQYGHLQCMTNYLCLPCLPPQAVFLSSRSQFFTLWTNPKVVNNLFFSLSLKSLW